MKKTKKQKRLELDNWKRFGSDYWKQEYIQKLHTWPIKSKRFRMKRFIKTLNSLKYNHFGGVVYSIGGGVEYSHRNKQFRILTSTN